MLYRLFYVILYMSISGSILWLLMALPSRLFKYRLSMRLSMISLLFFALPMYQSSIVDTDPTHDFLPVFKTASAVWLIGFLLSLAYFLLIAIAMRRKISRMRLCTNPQLTAMLEDCSNELGVKYHINLYESPLVANVRLYGVLSPCMIISPSILEHLSDAELKLVLTHELCHLENRDMHTMWVARFLCCVHWFNPVIWLACKFHETQCEINCDRHVLGVVHNSDKRAYASLIIKLVEIAAQSKARRIPVSVGISSYATIKMRLERIMAPNQDGNGDGSATALTVLTVLLALWLVVAFASSFFSF